MSENDGGGAEPSSITRRKFCALATGCVCGASHALALGDKPVDAGALADFTKDQISEKIVQQDVFIIRNKGRLFAVTAVCPHKNGYLLVDPKNPKRIICSNHNAVFDAEGVPLSGPVHEGLLRFGVSVNDQRRVIVDPNQQFPQSRWGEKASYVAIH